MSDTKTTVKRKKSTLVNRFLELIYPRLAPLLLLFLQKLSEGHCNRALTPNNMHILFLNQKYQAWLELETDQSRSGIKTKQIGSYH